MVVWYGNVNIEEEQAVNIASKILGKAEKHLRMHDKLLTELLMTLLTRCTVNLNFYLQGDVDADKWLIEISPRNSLSKELSW